MCQELASLGMQLARAAAGRALKEPQAALVFARLSREIQNAISLEARIAAQASSPPHRRAGFSPPAAPEPKQAAPIPPKTPTPPPPPSVEPSPEPDRRRVLRRVFDELTAKHPRRVSIRRSIAARVEAELAADPGNQNPAGHTLVIVAEEFGIDIEGAISQKTYEELVPQRFRPGPAQSAWVPPVMPRGTGPPRMVA